MNNPNIENILNNPELGSLINNVIKNINKNITENEPNEQETRSYDNVDTENSSIKITNETHINEVLKTLLTDRNGNNIADILSLLSENIAQLIDKK